MPLYAIVWKRTSVNAQHENNVLCEMNEQLLIAMPIQILCY